MANIIDQTYFVREILVAGIENPIISDPLCKFITEYEPRFLKKALGYEFYKLFNTALQSSPTSGRWYDLVVGADFYMGSTLYQWEGLKNTTLKESIIANYVYYYYMRDNITQTAILGEVKTNTENSSRVSANMKMVKAWNDMSRQVCILWDYLINKKDDNGNKVYPEFKTQDVDYCHFGTINHFSL
jgi:hypothetical protein